MALAPLPLRLANLRRLLNKRVDPKLHEQKHAKILSFIRTQSIPVYIKKDSIFGSCFVAVVMEYMPKDKGLPNNNNQPWYYLHDGDFETIEKAADWIAKNCEYYIPEYIG